MEGISLEGLIGKQCCIAVYNDFSILKSDKGDEKSDTNADCGFQGHGNGIENRLTHIGKRKYDKYNTFYKYRHQSDLPGISHIQYYGISKISIQAHTGSQCKRIVCEQCHHGCADKCSKRSCDQNRMSIHSRRGKNVGVNRKDVSHCHERGNTGHDFCLHIGFVFLQFEELF